MVWGSLLSTLPFAPDLGIHLSSSGEEVPERPYARLDDILLLMKCIENLLQSFPNVLIELGGNELYQLDAGLTKATSKHLHNAASFTSSSSIALLYLLMKVSVSPILLYASKEQGSMKD